MRLSIKITHEHSASYLGSSREVKSLFLLKSLRTKVLLNSLVGLLRYSKTKHKKKIKDIYENKIIINFNRTIVYSM